MGLFDSIFGSIVPGISGVIGLVEGIGAEDRAKRARERALTDLSSHLASQVQQMKERNRYGLNKATGVASDAVHSLGTNLGASLAGAGVYNSSATAGALASATRSADTALADQAGTNYYNEQDLMNQNQRYLSGLQYNLGNQQVGEASQQLGGAASGLSSFLGSLGQFNLARTGANAQQNSLSRPAGGYGNQSVLAPTAGTGGLSPYAFGGTPPASNYNPDFGSLGTTPGIKPIKPRYAYGF